MSHGLVRWYANPLAIVLLAGNAHGVDIYVDDDAPMDPGPRDPDVSDPLEDGSAEHPFDAIQEALDLVQDGDSVLVFGGSYAGEGNHSFVIDQAGGFSLTITGVDGADETVIHCERIASGFHVIGDAASPGHTSITGLTIENAFATVGAGIHTSGSARVAISGCAITGCVAADNGGGLSITGNSTVSVVDTRLEGNTCQDSGGGANVIDSTVTFDRCRFIGNESLHLGGGLLLRQSTAAIDSCRFEANVANQGGGLHSFANDTLVVGSDFIANAAVEGSFDVIGGGASVVASEASFIDCNFSSNTADFRGGGMMATFSTEYGVGSTTTVERCTFFDNHAEDGGGAFVTNSEGTFRACDFRNNRAADDGGGIGSSAGEGSAPTIISVSGGSFVENEARDDGGGMFLRLSNVTVESVVFTGNTVNGAGGAITLSWSPDVLIDACTFQWNGALHGGAVHVESATGRITSSDFDGNSATGDGGAISLRSAWVTLLGSSLSDNYAGDQGGATYASDATLDLISTVIQDNAAEDGGGGSCFALVASSDVINCVYASNSTGARGGAISAFNGPTIDVDSSTLGGNAAASGGGIAVADEGLSAFVFVNNSILWGNTGGPAHATGSSAVTIDFSCVEGGWFGTGNVATDPLFIDAIADNYHLTSASTCIDLGDRGRLPADSEDLDDDGDSDERLPVDFDRRQRVVQGGGSTPELDMGAYEYQLVGDVDGDGIVDFADLLAILDGWGPCPPPCPPICSGDANNDCIIDFEDLLLVLGSWS